MAGRRAGSRSGGDRVPANQLRRAPGARAPLLFPSGTAPKEAMDLTIVLHLGTLGSILVYYFRRIWRLVGEDRRVLWLLGRGDAAGGGCGARLQKTFGRAVRADLAERIAGGLMLPVTGGALLWAMRPNSGNARISRADVARCPGDRRLPGRGDFARPLAQRNDDQRGPGPGNDAAGGGDLFVFAGDSGAGGGRTLRGVFDVQGPPAAIRPAAASGDWGGHFVCRGAGCDLVAGAAALRGQLKWLAWYCIVLGVIVVVWQQVGRIRNPSMQKRRIANPSCGT